MNYSMSHHRMLLKIHVNFSISNYYDVRLDAYIVFFHAIFLTRDWKHTSSITLESTALLCCIVYFPPDCDKSPLMNWISYLFLLQNQTLRSKCLRPSVPKERPQRSARRGPLPTSSPCSTNHRSRSSRRPLIWSIRTETASSIRRIYTTLFIFLNTFQWPKT